MNKLLFIVLFLLLKSNLVLSQEVPKEQTTKYNVFSFDKELILPGSPEIIYDAITGDISAWWDHSYSDKPYKFFIEPKPGGGFYEIFNDEGDGVLHATVILAERGKRLRFDGPLGLSGTAIKMVHTYEFEEAGQDSTKLKLSVHAAGEMNEKIGEIVSKVWDHFLFEKFKPYVEKGEYLNK
ncbi:SRPBCC domain-containing protein [Bacteroidota bacterium]